MKKLLPIVLITIGLVACQKEQSVLQADDPLNLQFESADNKITGYLDVLDNPNTSKEQSAKIICEDYPRTYKNEYVPALLKITPSYTNHELQQDLDNALNYYKRKLNITCEQ